MTSRLRHGLRRLLDGILVLESRKRLSVDFRASTIVALIGGLARSLHETGFACTEVSVACGRRALSGKTPGVIYGCCCC